MRFFQHEVAMPYEDDIKELQELASQEEFNRHAMALTERVEMLEQKIDLLSREVGVRFENGLHLIKDIKKEK